jgi:hypothetical protein
VLALNNIPIDHKPPPLVAGAVVALWLALCLTKTVLAYDANVSDEALTTVYKVLAHAARASAARASASPPVRSCACYREYSPSGGEPI